MALFWRQISKEHLAPDFLADVETLLGESPYSWYVTRAFASREEQEALYQKHLAGGPRAAPPGKSAHEYGLAIDVVPDEDLAQGGLQPTWNTRFPGWLWLRDVIKPHPRLRHGSRFGDWPHVEAYPWRKHPAYLENAP